MKTKFMTLMTVATLGIFSAATVMAAGNNDFYTQPPAGSEWEKADTKGTYASYTNANYAQTECQFRYCGTAIPFLTVRSTAR